MASDDMVWQIIGTDFCSFKLKTSKAQTFCRNEYNTTGFCSKQACPLACSDKLQNDLLAAANSRYATIRSDAATGSLYLYIKEPERCHLPSRMWEKIRLPSNYTKALDLVSEHLKYYPKFLVHKNKQRLTRLTQVAIRIRKLEKEQERLGERLVPRLAPKVRRREEGRERRALAAAKIERSVERVLVDRLRSGAYGDRPLNVEANIWERVLNGLEKEGRAVGDADSDDGFEEEDEFEYERNLENGGDVEYVSDIEDSDEELEDFEDWVGGQSPDEEDEEENESAGGDSEEGDSDDDDAEALKKTLANLKRKRPAGPPPKAGKKPSKDGKSARRKIEYETEREPLPRELVRA